MTTLKINENNYLTIEENVVENGWTLMEDARPFLPNELTIEDLEEILEQEKEVEVKVNEEKKEYWI